MELPQALKDKYPSLKKFEDVSEDDFIESHDGRETTLLNFIFKHPALDQMRGNPVRLCEAIDEFANNHDFLINIGPDKAGKVFDVIAKEKPAVFVELGGYVGYSAIAFGQKMRDSLPKDSPFTLWSLEFDPLCAAIAMSLIDLAGLGDHVKVMTGAAAASMTRLKAEGKLDRIDMMFLDHLEDLYVPDLKHCEELGLLVPGSVVLADNVLRPGAPEYREYVTKHPKLETSVMKGLIVPGDFEDEVWVSKVK